MNDEFRVNSDEILTLLPNTSAWSRTYPLFIGRNPNGCLYIGMADSQPYRLTGENLEVLRTLDRRMVEQAERVLHEMRERDPRASRDACNVPTS